MSLILENLSPITNGRFKEGGFGLGLEFTSDKGSFFYDGQNTDERLLRLVKDAIECLGGAIDNLPTEKYYAEVKNLGEVHLGVRRRLLGGYIIGNLEVYAIDSFFLSPSLDGDKIYELVVEIKDNESILEDTRKLTALFPVKNVRTVYETPKIELSFGRLSNTVTYSLIPNGDVNSDLWEIVVETAKEGIKKNIFDYLDMSFEPRCCCITKTYINSRSQISIAAKPQGR